MSRPTYDSDPENDPRYSDPRQQRGQGHHRRPQEEDSQQDAQGGGLGGILGGILGGMGQPQQHQDDQEDPRYSRQQEGRHSQVEQQQASSPRGGGGGLIGSLLSNPRVAMAILIALGSLVTYFVKNQNESNPVTDETHRVPWGPAKDVPLGLQAAPEMMAQHGGELPDPKLQAYIDKIGNNLVRSNAIGDWAPVFNQYKWDFHLLRDPETINAFALPGGQIFFTYGLFKKLETEDEVAGVLGHEIGHVIARHSAQQMAKSQLISGMVMAGVTATSDGSQSSGQMAQTIGAMVNMKYGRGDESQADLLGTQFMVNARYNPNGLVKVMEVLKAAMGGSRQPEFMSTHPDPGNRVEHIKSIIEQIKRGELEGPKDTSIIPQQQ